MVNNISLNKYFYNNSYITYIFQTDCGLGKTCYRHEPQKGYPIAMQNPNIDWRDWIVSDPNLCHGQACIKGTRIPAAIILDNLAAGMSETELLQSYPTLTPEAIRAVLAYAAE
jgi:uncharacterized protein (DUF433 family)